MPSGIYKRIKKRGGWKVKDTSRMGRIWSRKQKDKISKKMSGHPVSQKTKDKIGKANSGKVGWMKGKHWSKEYRRKMSECRRGEKNHLWRGGITSINKTIRRGIEWKLWRESIFVRDNFTCLKCHIHSGWGYRLILHPHHIKNFSNFPELRFAIDNGITFCEKCHKEFHKEYGNQNNTKEQLEEFLRKKI